MAESATNVSRRTQSAFGRKRGQPFAASDEQRRRLAVKNGVGWLPHHALGECDLPSTSEKLSEGGLHRRLCRQMVSSLFFRLDVERSSVQEDMFVYFDGADGKRRQRSPDVFVIHDRPMRDRQSYIVWKEGKPPDFALEVVSASTWRTDIGKKPRDYAVMGVKEFFLFDPHEHVKPRLRCGRLNAKGKYDRLPVEELPEGHLGVYSEVLKAHVCHSEPWLMTNQLRLYDPAERVFVDVQLTDGPVEGAEGGANIQHELVSAAAKARIAMQRRAEAAEANALIAAEVIETMKVEARAATAEIQAERAKVQTAAAKVQAAEAKTQTARAETRTAQAEVRAAKAEALAAQAKVHTAEAQTQIARAEAQTASAEVQASAAEVARLKALLRAHGIAGDP